MQKGLFGPLDGKTSVQKGLVRAEGVRLVRVAFESAGDNLFDYAVPEHLSDGLSAGQRIRAPLGKGNRLEYGFCVEFPPKAPVEWVKSITEVVDERPLVDESMIQLARWIADYYCCPLGVVLSAVVPAAVKKQAGMVKRGYLKLTEAGIAAMENNFVGFKLSSKGREILCFLKVQEPCRDKVWPLDEIRSAMSCGMVPFTTLARHGLIDIIQRKELARPEASLKVIPTDDKEFELNDDQVLVLEKLEGLLQVAKPVFNVVVLHGVTGSGKTEIYMSCIKDVLRQGRQALVLVPEIAMTPQTVSRFLARFSRVAVLHSGLTNVQRHQYWRWIADGDVEVVVGARSAVFAPLRHLGLIIVDEEHETGYKQDTAPRYHGRDVAIKRAHLNSIPIILGSATPSLESLYNCQMKKHYHLFKLPRRVMDLPLPRVMLVDMAAETMERTGRHLLSRLLEKELQACLDRKKQAILLLNRRGHSNYVFCPSCKFALTCPNCDVSLTVHKSRQSFDKAEKNWVMCHYCLHSSQVPKLCPVCQKKLLLIGPGTQRAEEELQRKFPQARLQRVDSDAMRPGSYEQVLADFATGTINILMGTQMVGKGLDFPNVELVGVLNADTALSLPDFRSSERTFQLIEQVAGRAGRASDQGRVIVQTFVPNEQVITLACKHNFNSFARHEIEIRKKCKMPPYQRLARIILRDVKLEKLESAAKRLRENIDQIKEQMKLDLEIRGPFPAAIARLENYHRQEILFKSPAPEPIQMMLNTLRKEYLASSGVQAAVDVDPVNLL
ncbi:MAG: primosomal protein N' [Sedimentisphaerales bacterium]|nr:primosomal protein N' [Sedimentisphaerales bacterium]